METRGVCVYECLNHIAVMNKVSDDYRDWTHKTPSGVTPGLMGTCGLFDLLFRGRRENAPLVPKFKETAACNRRAKTLDGVSYSQSRWSSHTFNSVYNSAVGSCDAEMKVPSSENTELKRSPFRAWSRSVYSHTCYTYCQGFLPCLFLPFRSIHLHFFQTSSDFSCVGCG